MPVSPARSIVEVIDESLTGRVLVFGSLPPTGRDLDLLARPHEQAVVARVLAANGYVRSGVCWACFRSATAVAVDLVPIERWNLPPAAVAAVFADSEQLSSLQHLVRPAAHHELLIAARRYAGSTGELGGSLRRRVEEAISRNPHAFEVASAQAPAWSATRALRLLCLVYRGERRGIRRARLMASVEQARSVLVARDRLRRLHHRLVRGIHRGPWIVAFSGLDGAGKSSQASALQAALAREGIESMVVWPPAKNLLFGLNPTVKRRLRSLLERTGAPDATIAVPPPSTPAEPEFPALPRQHPLVAHTLAALVAVAQVLALRRISHPNGVRPRVVIYDRFTLDAIVYLQDRWGHGRPLRWQSRLIRLLARRPAAAYLLDLEPEIAFARKQDYPLQTLRDRAVLYRRQHGALHVTRLDATRAADELSAEIAHDVWARVGRYLV